MIYILTQTYWNDTLPLKTNYSAYKTRELAEKTVEKLKSLNQNNVSYRIVPVDYYKSETKIPILNE